MQNARIDKKSFLKLEAKWARMAQLDETDYDMLDRAIVIFLAVRSYQIEPLSVAPLPAIKFHGSHVGYQSKTISVNMKPQTSLIPPTKFQFNPTYCSGGDVTEFQDSCHGGHLGYMKEMILKIIYLHVILMPPAKFQFNLRYGLRRDVV